MALTACVGLKADDPPPGAGNDAGGSTDGPGHDGGVDPGDANGLGPDGGPLGGVSLSTIPDHRADEEFTSTIDNVVVDNVTGLRWSKNGVEAPLADDFASAKKACSDTRTEYAEDWRLPTLRELLSVVDFTKTTAFVWPSAFSMEGIVYWSTDEMLSVIPIHSQWTLNFGGPNIGSMDPKPSVVMWARCVRGPTLPRASFVIDGSLVRDTRSGLLWERVRSPDKMSVTDAATRCAALSIDGKTGFHLPAAKQLLSLLDDSRVAAPYDHDVFPAPRGGVVMSVALERSSGDDVYAVDFDNGSITRVSRSSSKGSFARCVR